jgi:phenylpropionate dioxygenase-like ring-hydroxylating dioxygenase large terminal subunit
MFLKQVWYVAAWSHEVPQQGVLSRKLLGEDVVFYRKADGTVVALADRCPHRAAPLSLGRREGDALRCMYHGLLFDAAGACLEVPGAERTPPGLKARTYPVVERDRYLWIWMGDPAAADPSLVPDAREQADPDWRYNPGYLHYGQASYLLIMDNLLDFSHLGFVHENTLGGGRFNAEVRSQVERFDWGLRVTRKYASVPLAPFLKNVAKFSGPVDRWQIYDWRIAGNQLVMSAGSAPAGTGALEGRYVPEAVLLKSIQSLTPETETSTHYFWMLAHNTPDDPEALSAELERQTIVAFDEDRRMIEAQQAILLQHPDAPMGAIPADAALNQGRWLLKKMLDREAAPHQQSA